ncbi:MAG: DUF3795 domain-containing protein [Anaerolineae bacterium]|nr:DUF3795 domain-containing protein [Anaerolineae bacterium]
MDFRLDTYCGLYCGACDILVANWYGAVEELAQAWGVDPNDLRCHGCKSGVVCAHCENCAIRQCAQSRAISFCCECEEYPCAGLMEFRYDGSGHHALALRNLRFIYEQGLERWLEAQQARWTCPTCGAGFGWYDQKCRHCGATLYDCESEAQNLIDD